MRYVKGSHGVEKGVNLKTIQTHVNICDTVQLLAGILQYNGGKFEEAEDFKCVFVVYCMLEQK